MKLPSYAKYKASGIQWVRQLPEHWSHAALRRVATRFSGGTPDRNNDSYWDEGNIPWINSGAVNQRLITEPSTFISEEGFRNSSAKWVPKGALVMALAGQGKTKAMVAQTAMATTCNQSMAAICPDGSTNARYLYWLLVSQYDDIRNMAGGEQRDGLNLDILGSIPTLKIPKNEQRAIADFLDREAARLDTLVGKKRELIEKLKEKRTALISRTITRGLTAEAAAKAGLNPNPKLKSSGIEWLGDIPKHWEIKRLKHLGSVVSGFAFDSGDFTSSGVRVLKIANVQTLRLDWSDDSYLPEEFYEDFQMFAVGDGDVVFALTRPVISTGLKAAIAAIGEERVLLNQRNALFKTFPGVSRNFFYHAIFSVGFRAAFETRIDFTGQQPNISPIDIGNIKVASPPLREQRAIADYLDSETAKLDRMIEKVEAAIEKLQEYRAALITATVTGKIDVRNGAQSAVST